MVWAVEIWRGVAAAMVVWAHWASPLGLPVGITAFAFTGVDLFFVLSGFVFAPSVMSPQRSIPSFFMRRIARIYPAYLVALALYVGLAWHAGKPLLYLTEHVLMAHMQSREMVFYYNPVFWSLPTEVAFYALVPLLGFLIGRFGRPLWVLFFATALAVRLAMIPPADGFTQNLPYVLLHHLPGLLIEFFVGVWVWDRLRTPLSSIQKYFFLVLGLIGWITLASFFVQLERWSGGSDWRNGQLGLAAAICFSFLLLGSAGYTPPQKGFFLQSGVWAGRLSYSLYLLHIAWLGPTLWLVERWGQATGAIFGFLGLITSCVVLHFLIEEPFRRWGRTISQKMEVAQGLKTAP